MVADTSKEARDARTQRAVLGLPRSNVPHRQPFRVPGVPVDAGGLLLGGQGAGYQPPAMAPTIRNGSAPVATEAGSGASGGSCDRSCSQAKNRTNARRRWVAWSRIV